MTQHLDLETLHLDRGAHPGPESGFCVMEAVAYFHHEPWSDAPACTSLVIAAFLRCWNDDLDDEGRQILKPWIPKLAGTNTGLGDDDRRGWMLTDWMVRTYLPAWLRLAKLESQAQACEALPELVDVEGAERALTGPVAAAWAAAGTAAGTAAWAAAWAAAGDAAWAAAGTAAGAAAGTAAGDAAWAAAGTAAGDAAGDVAWDVAGTAAWAAAGDAAWAAAGTAAGAAAWAALKPTVLSLQESALELLDRMISVGKVAA